MQNYKNFLKAQSQSLCIEKNNTLLVCRKKFYLFADKTTK